MENNTLTTEELFANNYIETGKKLTKNYEGYSPKIYIDTVGKKTVGYGFNISDTRIADFLPINVVKGLRPLEKEEADVIFDKLYSQAHKDAMSYLNKEVFNSLSNNQKNVITDMAYNMGINKLSQFKKLKAALTEKNYTNAVNELKNSNWYKQVGRRSKEHLIRILQ
jgi:lysozyme